MKTKVTVKSDKIRATLKAKAIQMADASICGHCGVPYNKLNQHIPICLMNPTRKSRNGMVQCVKCSFFIPGKNVIRHTASCDGNMVTAIDGALQSFRSQYLNIMRGGDAPSGAIDKSLGYGKRAVPEVVRSNVEKDLMERGMPSDWSISPNLALIKPGVIALNIDDTDTADAVTDIDSSSSQVDAITAVVDMITDERSFAEVLNQIINLATYKLATR